MHPLPPVIYQTSIVSIRDFSPGDSYDAAEFALPKGGIVFVRSGAFKGLTGRNTFELDANYVFFSRAGDYLYSNPGTIEKSACTVIEYAGAAFPGTPLHEHLALCTSHVYMQYARLLHFARLGASEPVLNEAALALMYEALNVVPAAPFQRHEPTHMVLAIRELLNQSLTKPVSLAAIAKQFYLSPFAVSRAFHRETGISLRNYTRRLRLRKALMLILDRDATLGEIAATLGFYDESHFSKTFHVEFGVRPARVIASM